jgi:hypothetical protein
MLDSSAKLPSDEETEFNTYEIDQEIFKNKEFIQNFKNEKDKLKNKFILLPGLTEDEIKKKDPKSEYPKYFAKISTEKFDYMGILTNELKREKYGYSVMENKDEYLGEYKNEIRDGFGIYKFNPNEDEEEIYIGDYKDNKKTGQGLYLKIFKSVKESSSGEIILIDFDCGMGDFKDDTFDNGKIFTVRGDNETLYQGKINDIGLPSDEEALIVEGGDKLFYGKIINGELIDGRNIFVDENWNKKNSYYFTKTDNVENPFDFDASKKEDKDEEIIKMVKESNVKAYKSQIQNIFKDVCDSLDKFKKFESAKDVDFENNVKSKIKADVDKIIQD